MAPEPREAVLSGRQQGAAGAQQDPQGQPDRPRPESEALGAGAGPGLPGMAAPGIIGAPKGSQISTHFLWAKSLSGQGLTWLEPQMRSNQKAV